MHTVPMLFVRDVEGTSKWYRDFLGVASGHGGPEFEMLLADGSNVLQLHLIDADHHDHAVNLDAPLGHGVVVVVYVESAESCFARARELGLEITAELTFNDQANMHEFTVRDPNGYALMLCESHWT